MRDALSYVSAGLLVVAVSNPVDAATPVAPAGIPAFASLSVEQRDQLPDSTKVSLEKYIVTLGSLRASHRARSMRIAAAAAAGGAAGQAATSAKRNQVSLDGAHSKPPKTSNAVLEPATGWADNALEMQNFCKAARMAVCLYYPASTTLFINGAWASEIDPYITDVSVCTSQGGVHLASGCQYNYDAYYHAQFDPRSGFTWGSACAFAYWTVTKVDVHGAIIVDSVIPNGTTFTTGPTFSSCVVLASFTP